MTQTKTPTMHPVAARKRSAILEGARSKFLENGYATTSMDEIATAASVSVKTIYNHFSNKADLFKGVIRYICIDDVLNPETQTVDRLVERFDWFGTFTASGLEAAGRQYLGHLLSLEQLALYRMVVRDASRFPEIGHLYKDQVSAGRTAILMAYLSQHVQATKSVKRDTAHAVSTFESLLRADLFEDALIGLRQPTAEEVAAHATTASRVLLQLLNAPGTAPE